MSEELALLLAGGASRRLGRDKLWLDAGGTTLLRRRVRTLCREFRCCAIAVDPRRAVACPEVAIWPDPAPGAGPLPVLAAALERWGGPIYLAAVDQPDDESLRWARLREARRDRIQASAWLFENSGRLQPLGAVYAPMLVAALMRAIARGESSLQRFLRARDDLCVVDGGDSPNLNRGEDLRRWREE